MSEALAVTDEAALAAYADVNTDGWEDFSAEDVVTPFLSIAQGLSPQRKKSSEKYIPGLEEGQVFNTATGEVLPDTFRVVPIKYTHEIAEFKTRESGGGLVGRFPFGDPEIKALIKNQPFGKWRRVPGDEASNELVETYYLFVLILGEDGTPEYEAMLGIKGVNISNTKRLITALRSIMVKTPKGRRIPPLFANEVAVTTVAKSNPKGESFVFHFSPSKGSYRESLLDPAGLVYQHASALAGAFASGEVKVNYDQTAAAEDNEEEPPF